jgi:hypothetical protein
MVVATGEHLPGPLSRVANRLYIYNPLSDPKRTSIHFFLDLARGRHRGASRRATWPQASEATRLCRVRNPTGGLTGACGRAARQQKGSALPGDHVYGCARTSLGTADLTDFAFYLFCEIHDRAAPFLNSILRYRVIKSGRRNPVPPLHIGKQARLANVNVQTWNLPRRLWKTRVFSLFFATARKPLRVDRFSGNVQT